MKRLIFVSLVLMLFCTGLIFAEEAATGKKKPKGKFKIGIGEIEYRAEMSKADKDRHAYGLRTPAENTKAFIDMLTTAIAKTRKFELVERDRMADILKEQALGESEVIEEESAQKLGTVRGLDYIILGAITEYGIQSKGLGGRGFGIASSKAVMAVDIRIIDAATGSIAIAETVSESKKASGGLAIKGFEAAEKNEKVLSDVMRECADSIASVTVSTIYPVKIVSVGKTGTIMVNYGKGFLGKGDVLDVFSQGEEIIDPDTGEVLGSEEEKVGRIKITDVQAKFSKGKAVIGADKVARGMICRKVSKKQLEAEKKAAKKSKKKKGLF